MAAMNDPGDVLFGKGPGAFEPMTAAVAVLDADGVVTGWTHDARRLLGWSAAEVVGRPVAALVEGGDGGPDPVRAFLARFGAGGSWSGRVRARHRDGRVVPLDVRAAALSGGAGADADADPGARAGADAHARAEGGSGSGHAPAGWLLSASGKDAVDRATWNAAVSEALMVRSPLVVIVWDPRLRYIWVNDATVTENRIPRDQWIRRRIDDVLPGVLDTPPFEAAIRRVLDTGVPALDYEFNRLTPWDSPHREHTFTVSFYRLDGADGAPLGVIGLRADVTASRRARARLDLLSEASTRIGTTLDVFRTAQELADYAVPLLADFVTVDLAEAVPLGEEPLERLDEQAGLTAVFRRAGAASIHQAAESLWSRGRRSTCRRPHPSSRSCAPDGPSSSRSSTPHRAPGSTRTPAGAGSSGRAGCTRC